MKLLSTGRSLAGITLIGGFCLIGWIALKETRIHDPRLVSYDRLPAGAMEECMTTSRLQRNCRRWPAGDSAQGCLASAACRGRVWAGSEEAGANDPRSLRRV